MSSPRWKVYVVDRVDGVFAVVALLLGYVAWNWVWPRVGTVIAHTSDGGSVYNRLFFPGIGVTLFFVVALGCSVAYFQLSRVRLSWRGVVGAVVILLGAIPFSLYDTTPVHVIAGGLLVLGYVTWHGYVARTAVGASGGLMIDAVNQVLPVPVGNLGAWGASLRHQLRGRKKGSQIVFAVVGVLVALPLIGVVVVLLMNSDPGFQSWMDSVAHSFTRVSPWTFLWQFSLGIPLAVYWFASLYGNAHPGRARVLTQSRTREAARAAHTIATVALAAPMALLCLIYVVFFAAMGAYLFSAFASHLPHQYTYAEYARQGFFELTVVAGINLAVVGFSYVVAQRHGRAYPRVLRIFGVVLSGLTLLLIATAISKMILYIDMFGLTRLRLYTTWFMIVMFAVFLIVGARHVRRFRVGVPVLLISLVSFLGLAWANTDALIADYDVDRYLSGDLATVDVMYLSQGLSSASLPALTTLSEQASSPELRAQAGAALAQMSRERSSVGTPWTAWNWQLWQGDRSLAGR